MTEEQEEGYKRKIDKLELEAKEHNQSFELRWKADMRAIKRWQEKTGRKMVWPDHADMVVWLMERLEEAESKLAIKSAEGKSK